MHPRRTTTVIAVIVACGCLAGCAPLVGPFGSVPVARPSASTPTPVPTPTLDPYVARELTTALTSIRALEGVADASKRITLSRRYRQEPGNGLSPKRVEEHSFHASFTVAMTPDATAQQTAQVTRMLGRTVGWTGVDLSITTPAVPGRIATTQSWNGTFDGNVDDRNSLGVAEGLYTLAATAGVQSLSVGIPYTGRIDYGSLWVTVSPNDAATLAAVRAVIDTTEFRNITLHGSFGNGAKP
ncbi:hypothetical protein GCM10028798_28980 [Humibacter antri]